MTAITQPGVRIVSTAVGLSMSAVAGAGAHGAALAAAMLAVAAVLAATVFRPAATLAVLATVVAIVLSDPSPLLGAVGGLLAAVYLVLRYAVGVPGATGGWPTMVAAVGFAFAGFVATSFPLQLPWLPLLAPPVIFAIYIWATRPFLG